MTQNTSNNVFWALCLSLLKVAVCTYKQVKCQIERKKQLKKAYTMAQDICFLMCFGPHFHSLPSPVAPFCMSFIVTILSAPLLKVAVCAFKQVKFQLDSEKILLYCTISNCSACHGSQAPLTAPKLVCITGHIVLGRL